MDWRRGDDGRCVKCVEKERSANGYRGKARTRWQYDATTACFNSTTMILSVAISVNVDDGVRVGKRKFRGPLSGFYPVAVVQ